MSDERSCGACNLCCVLPRIDTLHKPAGVPCPHLEPSETGCCGIYLDRPHPCRVFDCAWRVGQIDERFAPSATGIMAQMYGHKHGIEPWILGMHLWLDPTRHRPGPHDP